MAGVITTLESFPSSAGRKPFFAIGGIDLGRVPQVLSSGADRIVVVRAVTEAADPEKAARELRAAVTAPSKGGSPRGCRHRRAVACPYASRRHLGSPRVRPPDPFRWG